MTEEHEFDLVMPFVVCRSQGGPYDDEAYVAGFEAGMLHLLLEARPPEPGESFRPPVPIHAGNRAQVDLIAMEHDLVAEFEEASDGWAYVTIRREGD